MDPILFLAEYNWLYDFMWIWSIESRYIVIGMQERNNWTWREVIDTRRFNPETMIFLNENNPGAYYIPNRASLNPNGCQYWNTWLTILQNCINNNITLEEIFFTESDPFPRENNKQTIKEFYELTDNEKFDFETLPFWTPYFQSRKEALRDLLKRSTAQNEPKIIFISRSPKEINTPLYRLFEDSEIIQHEILYKQENWDFNYKRISIIWSDNILLEVPHVSHINQEMDEYIVQFRRNVRYPTMTEL